MRLIVHWLWQACKKGDWYYVTIIAHYTKSEACYEVAVLSEQLTIFYSLIVFWAKSSTLPWGHNINAFAITIGIDFWYKSHLLFLTVTHLMYIRLLTKTIIWHECCVHCLYIMLWLDGFSLKREMQINCMNEFSVALIQIAFETVVYRYWVAYLQP